MMLSLSQMSPTAALATEVGHEQQLHTFPIAKVSSISHIQQEKHMTAHPAILTTRQMKKSKKTVVYHCSSMRPLKPQYLLLKLSTWNQNTTTITMATLLEAIFFLFDSQGHVCQKRIFFFKQWHSSSLLLRRHLRN